MQTFVCLLRHGVFTGSEIAKLVISAVSYIAVIAGAYFSFDAVSTALGESEQRHLLGLGSAILAGLLGIAIMAVIWLRLWCPGKPISDLYFWRSENRS